MTVAEMRALLELGPEVSDAAVVEAYAASISEASATPSSSTPPISLEAAKSHLGLVDFDDDDQLIADLLASAVDIVERKTGLVLSRRPVIETADRLTAIRLRSWPIASIDAVTYLDGQHVEQLLDPAVYRRTIGRPVRIVPTGAWPLATAGYDAVTIALTAGFDGPEDVPGAAIHAIKVLLAEFYLNREAGEISEAAERSLRWLMNELRVKRL